MLTFIIFIIILGILIFVHEFGHFIVARRNGVKAEEFGFGFPPRAIGMVYVDKTKKWKIIKGNKEVESNNTIYSLNWVPFGGFVRIKGEGGDHSKDADSLASKSAWIRFKVFVAGVTMNFILAWLLLIVLLIMGVNQEIGQEDASVTGAKIQVAAVVPKSPAYEMDLREGDTLLKCVGSDARCEQNFSNISELQSFIADHKGQQITLEISRGDKVLDLIGTPRTVAPQGEGLLGIEMAQTKFVRYSLWAAIKQSPIYMWNILVMMGMVLRDLFTGNAKDIGGPVAVIHFTKQAAALGLSSLIQLTALLSLNLAIVNFLPIPALDGGHILFVIIEKIKGSPVNRNVENWIHTAGFFLLMALMVYMIIHDISRYGLGGIF
ncbi:MAG TPA: M50 family metallopeptidase [Patescibacteria group bacterium]